MTVAPAYPAVLRRIAEALAAAPPVDWALTGSLALALQGLPVEPHDIDLQTDAAGAYEIERRLARYSTRPVVYSAAAAICSHFGALAIDGIEVEIMGEVRRRLPDGTWDEPTDLIRHRRWISTHGLLIPVLTLDYEAQAYRKLGRTERAALIRRWIEAATGGT